MTAANVEAQQQQRPTTSTPTLRIPSEFSTAAQTAPSQPQFPMTGAQVFAQACKDEGVAALFCCPGNYGVINALANIGVRTFSGRHEGAMTHAADAFIRVTGELAVASGTEGPGFTDMICGIACANAARTPLLIVASNMALRRGSSGPRWSVRGKSR
jgi:acetolactate synthase I/II/III large subunit